MTQYKGVATNESTGDTLTTPTITTPTITTPAISGGTALALTSLTTTAASTVGFYGVTAVVQPTGASQTAITASQTTKTTTQLRAELSNAKTLLAKIRKDLKALGLLKGSA